MALRTVHVIFGQSNARGAADKTDLTDTRYDVTDADVQQCYVADADPVAGPSNMAIGSDNFAVEAAIGHGRKAAGEAKPLILRFGVGGTSLASSWDPTSNTSTFADAMAMVWERFDYCRRTAFSGDTFEFRSFTWVQGEADANGTDGDAEAYGDNLIELIDIVRRELSPNIPVFIPRLSDSYAGTGYSAYRLAQVQAGQDAAAASRSRVYAINTDDVPLQADDTHYTADGYMDLGGLILASMAADGLSGVTQRSTEGRVFTSSATADTFGSSCQTEQGARDESPANGGFGSRGPGAVDPWPTTPRSALMAHPYRDEWLVVCDSGIDGDGDLDSETDRRPFDDGWWSFVT